MFVQGNSDAVFNLGKPSAPTHWHAIWGGANTPITAGTKYDIPIDMQSLWIKQANGAWQPGFGMDADPTKITPISKW
jgi:hypothetical protein